MEKFSRNQRVVAITKILIENPSKVINLNRFTELFNAAKSTISEDLVIVREVLSRLEVGRVETLSGASGGVKYVCEVSKNQREKFAEEICTILRDKARVIPGNFLYITDIMYNPQIVKRAGEILSASFNHLEVDYVVTVETKGIPLAYEVAKMLGVQLIIVRRDTKVTEGTTVSINYVTGSNKRIQNMSLSKNAMKKGSRCVFIDDFMKAGGTALGIINLLKEFESELLGIGVLVDNVEKPTKLLEDYVSIIQFKGVDENENAILSTSRLLK